MAQLEEVSSESVKGLKLKMESFLSLFSLDHLRKSTFACLNDQVPASV